MLLKDVRGFIKILDTDVLKLKREKNAIISIGHHLKFFIPEFKESLSLVTHLSENVIFPPYPILPWTEETPRYNVRFIFKLYTYKKLSV